MYSPDLGVEESFAQLDPEFTPTSEVDRREMVSSSDAIMLPTPPASHGNTPILDSEPNDFVSISTAFHPEACLDSLPPDIVLISFDSVSFYVHSYALLGGSRNNFNFSLPIQPTDRSKPRLSVSEPSSILNIVLHTIYNRSCAQYAPSYQDLVCAVQALEKYGLPLEEYIRHSKPLFTHLMCHAPVRPLQVYVFAASRNLQSLAVATSSHLLSFPLSDVTDDVAEDMGAVYLRDLFLLHYRRTEMLKRLVIQPPASHQPTTTCGFVQQTQLTRAWALAAAKLAHDARPDLPATTIDTSLKSLEDHISCTLCKRALRDRVKTLIVQWSLVKRTI